MSTSVVILIVWAAVVLLTAWPAKRLVRRNRHFRPWVWIFYILGTKVVFYYVFQLFLDSM